MGAPRIGYVVKRFPRVSETFIAQEILQLERLGVSVRVLSLVENDRPAEHAWLRELHAPVERIEPSPLHATWDRLSRRAREEPSARDAAQGVVGLALEHPFGRGRRYLCDAVAVADAAAEHDLDHLHAHFANRPAWVAMAAAALCDRSFSFTAHAKDIYRDTDDAAYWTMLLERCSFAVTVTKANITHLRAMVGEIADRKVRLLYNGVDVDRVRPRASTPDVRAPRIACVARMIEKKGVDVLLDALELLLRRDRALECDIVGDGPLAGPHRARAERLGLSGRVRFHGSTSHEHAVDVIRAADVFVLPCRIAHDGDRDALPTVLLEALAAGVPCVSTPVAGVPEIVVPEESGLLVAPDDVDALAGAIDRLTNDAVLRQRLSVRARRRAELLFDRERTGSRLAAWFRDSVRRPARYDGCSPRHGANASSRGNQDANRVRLH